MASKILPKNWDSGLTALTPAQRLFLFYYAQCPDLDWACENAGCARVTVRKKWKYQPVFAKAWANIIRGEVTDIIRAAAKDEAGKSFARIIQLRDQEKNPRVALDSAKTMLRAIEDPTFANRITVTKDIGENWKRVLASLMPEIRALSEGDIIEAEDWTTITDVIGENEEDAVQESETA